MTSSSPEGFDPEERWLEAGEMGGFTLRITGFWPEASAKAPEAALAAPEAALAAPEEPEGKAPPISAGWFEKDEDR